MEWYLEWSPFQASLEKARKRGAEVPALDLMVEPYDDLRDAWVAFFELCASRTMGHSGINPLQTTSILAWLDINGVIDIEDRRRYYELITVMDLEYLAHYREKHKDKQ
mgnify:FL=1